MLGGAVGERADVSSDEIEVVAVSAWPSPLVIDAVADPGRTGAPLYADVDAFTSNVNLEQFRAISLELPVELSDVGSRRVIAARFAGREQADSAAGALTEIVLSPQDAQISIAPLGEPGMLSDASSFVLVARVAVSEYGHAERFIVDEGGDVILSQLEQADHIALSGGGAEPALAAASVSRGFAPA